MSPFAVKSGFPDVSGCNKYHEWLNKWLVLVGLIVLTSFSCFVCDSIYWLPDLFSSNIGAADQSRRVDLRSWPHIHSISRPQWRCTPRKTNMSHENPPFWWYLPVKMGIFMGYVSFREGMNLENPLLLKGCHWRFMLPATSSRVPVEKVCKFSTSWFSLQVKQVISTEP